LSAKNAGESLQLCDKRLFVNTRVRIYHMDSCAERTFITLKHLTNFPDLFTVHPITASEV